jgi:hypothetical protein
MGKSPEAAGNFVHIIPQELNKKMVAPTNMVANNFIISWVTPGL